MAKKNGERQVGVGDVLAAIHRAAAEVGIEVEIVGEITALTMYVVDRADLEGLLANAVFSSHEATRVTGHVPDESDCMKFARNVVDIAVASGALDEVVEEPRPVPVDSIGDDMVKADNPKLRNASRRHT